MRHILKLTVLFLWLAESLKLVLKPFKTSPKPFWQFPELLRNAVNLPEIATVTVIIYPGSCSKKWLSREWEPLDPKTTLWPSQSTDNPAIGNHSVFWTTHRGQYCWTYHISRDNASSVSLNAGRASQRVPKIFNYKRIFLISITFILILFTQLQKQSNQKIPLQ